MNTEMHPITRLRPARRWALATKALLLFLAVWMLCAAPAQAALQQFGPIDPANGFPTWYQDTTGLALEHCLPQTQAELVWCVLPPIPNGTAPEVFPTNWAIENFYTDATSGVRLAPIPGTTQTATVLLIMALESSFVNGADVIPGQQMVFARTRIKVSPLPFSGTYTVYTPLGKFVFDNQVAGDRLFFTEDIGLAALDFAQALTGRQGPFLLPATVPGGAEVPPIPDLLPGQDPFFDALVAGGGATLYPGTGKKYIADPARLGPITGGKTGIAGQPVYTVNDGSTRDPNLFRVEGPNGFVFETTDFSLNGRIFEGAIAGGLAVDRASYARSATATKVDVYATASPSTQGRLPAAAAPAVVSTQLAYFDAACTPTLDAAGNPGPPYSAPAGLTATQMLAAGTKYFGQSHPATIPLQVCVQANAVNATGQTVTTFTPAPLGDQVFITEALYDPTNQALSVKATSSDQVVPPTLTVDGYGPIPATGQLLVPALLAAPDKVTVLSTGGGLNQLQMSTGPVAGGAPPLPVAVNDTATTLEDTPATIPVLANDTNAAGGTVGLVSLPLLGTAVVNPDGSVGYTPKLNAFGTDTFTYRVTVGTQVSNEASVTVTITPVNDPPVAVNDTAGALRGIANSVNVLANDTDPDGKADLARAVIVTGNANLGITAGSVFAGGVVTFTPPATTAAGPYTFTYNAVDQAGAVSALPATVTVTVSTTEAIVVAKDIYTTRSGRWTLQGTLSPAAGQTLTMTYVDGTFKVNGACTGAAAGTVIGSATVDALGNWLYDQILPNTAGVLNPSNTGGNATGFWCAPPKSVRITSSLTNGSVTSAISLK
jgi:hypothetical protein